MTPVWGDVPYHSSTGIARGILIKGIIDSIIIYGTYYAIKK